MHAGELTGEQTDQVGSLRVIEVAPHGISNHGAKLVKRLRLSKNRMAEGPRFVSAFGRFFDAKDNFRVGHRVRASLAIKCNYKTQLDQHTAAEAHRTIAYAWKESFA
jgi:hypothetical protein